MTVVVGSLLLLLLWSSTVGRRLPRSLLQKVLRGASVEGFVVTVPG